MKKSKTAALLAASLLIYGGAFSVQAIGADPNENEEGTPGATYTDEVYADAKGKLTLDDVTIDVGDTKFSAQGGTIEVTNSTVNSAIWAVRAQEENTTNYYGGQINISDSKTDVTSINVNGAESSSTIKGSTGFFKADYTNVTQTSSADDEQINDTGNTFGGHLTFTDGINAEIGVANVTGTNSQLTVSGDGTSVQAASLTVKPEDGKHGGKVSVTGGTLKVTGDAALTNSTLEAAGGSTQLAGMTASGSKITVSGGTVNAGGTVNMINNSSMSITGGSVTFNNWTATGGSTTVGEAEGETNVSTLADGNALTVTGTATLNDHDLTIASGETVTQNVLNANEGTNVTVKGALNVTGNASFDNSTLKSFGTTELGSLSSTGSSKVKVHGGKFTVDGATNTVQFYAEGGSQVELKNGGLMQGDVNAADKDSSALRAVGENTKVIATGITFKGGEVAADSGATLELNGGVVDVPDGWFSTEGGTITTNGTTINSGVWATKGTVSVKGGSISGDVAATGQDSEVTIDGVKGSTIGHVYATHQVMNNGKWEDDGNTSGSTVTFTNSTITAESIEADGKSKVSIEGGAQVTTHSLTAAGDSTVSVTGLDGATNSHLLIDGNATFSEDSTLSMESAANADVTGTLTFAGNAKMELTGKNTAMTFAVGSELYANNSSSTAPAITVKSGAKLHFAAGSATHTMASEETNENSQYLINTIAAASDGGTITVDENASLYIDNLDENKTYSMENVVTGNAEASENGWKGNAYGDSMLKVVDKETGKVTNRDFDEAYKGHVMAGRVYDAVVTGDKNSKAYSFVNDVIKGQSSLDDEEIARIAKALNSHSSLTGLAGVGYGTYRFTTAFTDHVANHEASDLWASYLHDKSSVDGLSVGNLRADYDLTYDGVVVGSDFYDNGRTTIGAAFAYADGDVSTKSGVSTKNDVDYYGGMIYGSVKGGAGMTYRAEIGYNRSSNDLTQWNTGKRITGSVDADAFHVGVAAEKEIRTGSSVWTPFLGLQYIDLSIDDYSDSLGFRHEGDSAGLWNMPVGVNYKYEVANGAWTYAPSVTLGYRFAFGDDSVDETLRYGSGAGSFGTEIAEDSFFTRIGFEAKKDNIGFGVHYGYERGSDTEANQWGINCNFFF